MQATEAREKEGGLWVAKVTMLLKICVKGAYKSQEYAFMPYVNVTHPIDIVGETLQCVCLK